MSKLPRQLSYKKVIAALRRAGFREHRQRGSHIILVKEGRMATLSVPDHREVAKGTLRSLIRSSGLTVEEFATLAGK